MAVHTGEVVELPGAKSKTAQTTPAQPAPVNVPQTIKGGELFVKCLENEGVECIFGVPGEENIDMLDALISSPIEFVATRHEQGAAFIADVYGRLTGKAGVCLSTLGPGATNLVTGVADANMDHAPLIAISGQGSTDRMHKTSHQVLDLVNLFDPITKYATQVREPGIIPEVVRKAFQVAEDEKPGACFIDFPENVASASTAMQEPLSNLKSLPSTSPVNSCAIIAEIISESERPLIMVGNGAIRDKASDAVVDFAEKLNIPVITTFMAKGTIPHSNPLCLGTIGLAARDYVSYGVAKADLVICIGVDMIEYHPRLWNPNREKAIVHIDQTVAEVDQHYSIVASAIGMLTDSLQRISQKAKRKRTTEIHALRDIVQRELEEHHNDTSFPMKPQKLIWDLRQGLNPEDIVISDVGAHKMWMARMFQAELPNTCIISNGFASMGIALPGCIAAKVAHPDRRAVAVCGDAGFMMNNQEIETALRMGLDFTVVIFNDSKYGLIEWHQHRHFDRSTGIEFNNPDFVRFAESFGANGYRVESTEDFLPVLNTALNDGTVSIIDVPVDYSENMKLTNKLKSLKPPI